MEYADKENTEKKKKQFEKKSLQWLYYLRARGRGE